MGRNHEPAYVQPRHGTGQPRELRRRCRRAVREQPRIRSLGHARRVRRGNR
jgi:hypothetical protein